MAEYFLSEQEALGSILVQRNFKKFKKRMVVHAGNPAFRKEKQEDQEFKFSHPWLYRELKANLGQRFLLKKKKNKTTLIKAGLTVHTNNFSLGSRAEFKVILRNRIPLKAA